VNKDKILNQFEKKIFAFSCKHCGLIAGCDLSVAGYRF
jgi:hypothetical protein